MSTAQQIRPLISSRPTAGSGRWKASAAGLLVGRMTDAAARWLLLVLLVRYCTPRDVGYWAVAAAVAAPVFSLLELRLRWLTAADGVPHATLADFVTVRLGTLGAVAVAATLLALFVRPSELAAILAAVFLTKSIELVSELAKGAAQRFGGTGRVAIGSGLRGLLGLAGVLVALRLHTSALSAVLGLAAGWLFVLLVWDLPSAWAIRQVRRELRRRVDLRRCFRIVGCAAPLAATAVLVGLGRGLPKFALLAFHGEQLVGTFAALAGLVAAGDIVLSSMTHAAIGPLGKAARHDRRAFRRIVTELALTALAIGTSGTLLSLLFGDRILMLIYGPTYHGLVSPLTIFSVAMTFAFLSGVWQVALVALRSARILPWIITVGVVSGVVTAWLLVPHFGLSGAAATTLAMTATSSLLLAIVLWVALQAPLRGRDESPPSLLRLVLAVTPTSSSIEQFTRLQRRRYDITLGSLASPHSPPPHGVDFFSGENQLTTFVGRLVRTVRKRHFDIVHFHAPHLAPCLLLACCLAGKPNLMRRTVYHIHSCWPNYSRRNRFLCLFACLVSARVITCSRSSTDLLPRVVRWWLGSRLQTVPNGVDFDRTDRCRPPSDPAGDHRHVKAVRAVVVATLRPIKNVETVLAAASCISGDVCQWTIVGGGPQLEELRRKSKELAVTDRVRFTGPLPRDETLTQLWHADILVSASHGEGLPVSVLEAMSTRCLIACSDIPPHRELDRVGSLLKYFAADDAQELAGTIQELSRQSNDERRKRAARIDEHCRRQFSAESMLKACDQVYAALLAPHRRRQLAEPPRIAVHAASSVREGCLT